MRRSAKRVGIIGFLTWLNSRQLANFDLVDLAEDYRWLRMRKSDEEIDWMRIGAAFSDLGLQALLDEGRVGMTERELGALSSAIITRLAAQPSFISSVAITWQIRRRVCHHSTIRHVA